MHKLCKHALESEQSGGRRGQRQPEVGREGEGRSYCDTYPVDLVTERTAQWLSLTLPAPEGLHVSRGAGHYNML